MKYLRLQPWVFIGVFILSFAWSIDQVLWPYILRVVIDTLTEFDANRSAIWGHLFWPLIAGLVLWISVEIAFRITGLLLAIGIPKMEAKIRMDMFDHIQHHSPKYFNDRFAGSLANKISDMTNQTTLILQEILTVFLPIIVTCILAVIAFFYVNTLVAITLAIWLIIHSILIIYLSKKCDHYEHVHGEARSKLIGKIVDSFTNNFAVNLFYRFANEKAFISKYQKEEQATNFAAKKYVEIMRFYLGQATFWGGGVAINVIMIYVWSQGQISTGEIAQIFNTTWNVTMVIWVGGTSLPALFQSIGISKQALKVMKDPQDVLDQPNAQSLVLTKGEIIFDQVTLQYGKKVIFSNKDVHIVGGEKIGLVGASGAGKSSFVNLILRFYEVTSGKILIDGQDISKVTLESMRRQIALIPQDPILFHRSVMDNIRYSRPDATDVEVIEAAKLAHCDLFIEKMPDKYYSMVGERGTKLSGGERQRIAIARAILSNAPILILDEATSALDSVTESYIQESLQWLMENRTSIVIAHRLSTLAGMDRVLVFDQGKIVEEGSHAELLELEGLYADMWNRQAGGFLPDLLAGEEEEEELEE